MNNTFYIWVLINLGWSAVLMLASARLFFLCRHWEDKFERRNRWIAEQERKQRQIL